MLKLLVLTLLVACGESPLLNHANEKFKAVGSILNQESRVYSFKETKTFFILDWTQGPQLGESILQVRAWNEAEGTLNGPYQDFSEEFAVDLWMPDMGHGSSPVKITKIEQGEYLVNKIYFIMSGKWEVRFKLKRQGKVVDEVVLNLHI